MIDIGSRSMQDCGGGVKDSRKDNRTSVTNANEIRLAKVWEHVMQVKPRQSIDLPEYDAAIGGPTVALEVLGVWAGGRGAEDREVLFLHHPSIFHLACSKICLSS